MTVPLQSAFAVGSFLALLSGIVLLSRPRHAGNFAFAGLVGIYATITFLQALSRAAPDADIALRHARAAGWATIAFPFFLALLLREIVPWGRALDAIALGIAAASLAAFAMVALDPALLVDHVDTRVGGFVPSAGPFAGPLAIVGYAIEASIVLAASRRAGSVGSSSAERKQAALVGAAFVFLLLPAGAWLAPFLVVAPASAATPGLLARSAGAIAAAFVAVASLPRLTGPFDARGRAALWGAAAIAGLGGLLDGVSLGLQARGTPILVGQDTTVLLWRAAFATALALALVRYGLAGAGRRARERLARATALALLSGAALLLVGVVLAMAGRPAVGLFVGGALVAGAMMLSPGPILVAARRLADHALPDPGSAEAAIERARSFLREASRASAEEVAALAEDLQIPDAERAILVELARDARPADLLGRYRILREIGRGSAGTASLCEDVVTGATVVIKRFHTRSGERAHTEARALSAVQGPGVLPLLAVERVADETILVTAHAPGGSAADLLHAGPIAPERALSIMCDLLEGLARVHDAGLLHLDIKPENVLMDAEGRALLADFGASRITPAPDATLTAGGETGTLASLAPEVAAGEAPSRASDIFGAGATLYRLVAGEPYIQLTGATIPEMLARIATATPRLPHAGIPEPLEPLLRCALSRLPADRFESARDMREAVFRVQASLISVSPAANP